jgi:hypothetical protein
MNYETIRHGSEPNSFSGFARFIFAPQPHMGTTIFVGRQASIAETMLVPSYALMAQWMEGLHTKVLR